MNILYRKQKQQKSLDNGATWVDTGEYRVGDVLENPSNCQSEDSKQCRWVELDASEGYYCDTTTFTKYTVQVEECTENGIIWTRTGNQKQGNSVIEYNSANCGYNSSGGDDGSVVYNCESIPIGNFGYTVPSNVATNVDESIWLNGTQHSLRTFTGITHAEYTTSYTLSDFSISTLTSCAKTFLNFTPNNIINSFFDTSNVTDMSYMFANGRYYDGCINLKGWNTSNVRSMKCMFAFNWSFDSEYNVPGLSGHGGYTYIYMPFLNTSNVTDMSRMFAMSTGTKVIDVRGWDISNVTNYENMFYWGNFNTNSVTIYLGDVTQTEYDWWYARIKTEGNLTNANIVYNIV